MKPPVLVISDIHFHAFKAHSRLIDGVNSRLLDQIRAWRQAIDAGAAGGCKLLLVPGDIFEVRGSIKPSVFNRVTELVMETLGRGFDIIMIPGNHDMEHLEAGESAIDSWDHLRQWANGAIVKECRVLKFPGLHNLAGYRVLGIPYIHDPEVFKETFRRLSLELTPDITMIHQGVDDFNTAGSYPATGITVEWLESRNPGIILVGHYHKPGRSESGRVINVGALVQHRFSDEGTERGCWILSREGPRFIEIQSPKFITLNGGGRKEKDCPQCSGAIVRVKAKSAKEAERLRERAERDGALSVVVRIEKEFKSAHDHTISISSPRAMLSQYLGIMERYREHKEELVGLFDRICSGRTRAGVEGAAEGSRGTGDGA